jgi:hypothetical protein
MADGLVMAVTISTWIPLPDGSSPGRVKFWIATPVRPLNAID